MRAGLVAEVGLYQTLTLTRRSFSHAYVTRRDPSSFSKVRIPDLLLRGRSPKQCATRDRYTARELCGLIIGIALVLPPTGLQDKIGVLPSAFSACSLDEPRLQLPLIIRITSLGVALATSWDAAALCILLYIGASRSVVLNQPTLIRSL